MPVPLATTRDLPRVCPGTTRAADTHQLAAAELTLTPEETLLQDEASEPPAPDYPYGEPGQSQRSRRIQGRRF